MNSWETFYHAADVGVRGRGATLEQAFAQGALALTSVVTEPARVHCRESTTVRCEAHDPELLFHDWLNALIYEMATSKRLFADFTVKIEGARLEATICGEAVDTARHAPAVEIKGATVTELLVQREPDGQWVVQCVVDV